MSKFYLLLLSFLAFSIYSNGQSCAVGNRMAADPVDIVIIGADSDFDFDIIPSGEQADIKEIPFQFYPNPVTDYLILPIPFKEAAFANFYSMDGKLCYSNALGDARQSVIDLSLLSIMLYLPNCHLPQVQNYLIKHLQIRHFRKTHLFQTLWHF